MAEVKVKDDGGATLNMVDVGGYIVPAFPEKDAATLKKIFDNMPTFSMRADDIMLCSFAKTGTNWLYEIISMMTRKSAERIKDVKYMSMMEAQNPESMEDLPSPRVMNSHLNVRFLPGDLQKKQVKTVLILRNPKDTAVSFYNHMKGFAEYGYEGEWKNWLPAFVQGEFEYCKYADYLREWQDAIEKGVGFPLHVMYYEDLKLNGVEELDKLEQFLDMDLGADLKRDIVAACHFDNMRIEKQALKESLNYITFKKGFSEFRKGQIGDWMNWFTVKQNEDFDKMWTNEGLKFPFKYTDPRT